MRPFFSLSYKILPSLRIAASSLCVVRAVVEDGAHWAIERLKAVNVPKISTPSLKDVKGTPASHTRLPARKFSLICGAGLLVGWCDAAMGASVLGTVLEFCGEKTLVLGGLISSFALQFCPKLPEAKLQAACGMIFDASHARWIGSAQTPPRSWAHAGGP